LNVIMIGEIIGALLILSGAVLGFLSAIGIIRFPDVYTRAHAASKSSSLGVLLILTGTFFYFWLVDGFISIRLLLALAFIFLTTPVGTHLMIRAAYRSGIGIHAETQKQQREVDQDFI
jgi:multicomponent Na+:H+ antiporter subunit G